MMKKSVFDLMRAEELTHFQIHYDWRLRAFRLYGAREWDREVNELRQWMQA